MLCPSLSGVLLNYSFYVLRYTHICCINQLLQVCFRAYNHSELVLSRFCGMTGINNVLIHHLFNKKTSSQER